MITLDKVDRLAWQFHDADLVSLEILWSATEVSLRLRCTVNFEEDMSQLEALGIKSRTVDIHFIDASIIGIVIRANCEGQEVILDWRFVDQDLHHHQIGGSCGSSIELRFKQLGIAEVRENKEGTWVH